jgi:hypothetical protein
MSNGAASSFTVAAPSANRDRMALRVGSASAKKVALSVSLAGLILLLSNV